MGSVSGSGARVGLDLSPNLATEAGATQPGPSRDRAGARSAARVSGRVKPFAVSVRVKDSVWVGVIVLLVSEQRLGPITHEGDDRYGQA